MGCEVDIQVLVVYSPLARVVHEVTVAVENGATVAQAVHLSGLPAKFPELDLSKSIVGIWGRKATLAHVLQDRDRVEVYRGLIVDPKEARRVRYRAHGEKTPRGVKRPNKRPLSNSSG